MRVLLAVMLLFALALSGCARNKAAQTPTSGSPRTGTATVRTAVLDGIVIKLEPAARFVVLSFPPDQMPAIDQRLTLYRLGAKVAEVKVSGPQRDNNIVADIVTGTPEEGDEARTQ
jgi:ABC-type Fe3+-hydroxamate transport system substrate-binding protein